MRTPATVMLLRVTEHELEALSAWQMATVARASYALTDDAVPAGTERVNIIQKDVSSAMWRTGLKPVSVTMMLSTWEVVSWASTSRLSHDCIWKASCDVGLGNDGGCGGNGGGKGGASGRGNPGGSGGCMGGNGRLGGVEGGYVDRIDVQRMQPPICCWTSVPRSSAVKPAATT